jgi:hypothetical protein
MEGVMQYTIYAVGIIHRPGDDCWIDDPGSFMPAGMVIAPCSMKKPSPASLADTVRICWSVPPT